MKGDQWGCLIITLCVACTITTVILVILAMR